ncbi:MAG: cytochrome C [Bacteroidota bacterium]
MNYPIWELYYLNSGTLVAIISILHVYISHLAVGGGFFLWYTDRKSVKENNLELREYVKKHTWFFLLLTMVFGGVTGVGIWFIIALANPAATSSLIHTFVFGWAIEWVFFVGEITALLIYHYRFEKMTDKDRLKIAFLYFLFAWLSLFIINGILSYMLTPGNWLENKSFWSGFFNPTYFPSLFFRTAVMALVAGLFGLITAVFMKGSEFRSYLIKYCSKWLLYSFPFMIIFGLWYFYSIPENTRFTNFVLNQQMTNVVSILLISTALLFFFTLFFIIRFKPSLQKIMVFILLIIGLGWFSGFEYVREYARKPYIIHSYMYSTSIYVQDEDKLNTEGILTHAKWTSVKNITEENKIIAGKEIFNIQCLSCHTINGIKNDVVSKFKNLAYVGIMSQIYGQGKVLNYMPKFIGTREELEALALFIAKDLLGKEIMTQLITQKPNPVEFDIPAFDSKNDEYVLLAWNDIGMKCITDNYKMFMFLPPGNILEALLIKRDAFPIVVSKGVEIEYEVEAGFENPSKFIDFWKYSEAYYGKKIPENIGSTGNGLKGKFVWDEKERKFIAKGIPVVPYKDDGSYNPYPRFKVKAIDIATGKILKETKVVAPVSSEMGCRLCHDGGWRINNVSGLADKTAANILSTHDRLNKTKLLKSAQEGKPVMCQSCHPDPLVKSDGLPGHNSFSAAMHGWHANYMVIEGPNACVTCHPSSSTGNTQCSRDIHSLVGLNCTSCHGNIDEHAASLLKHEFKNNTSAQRLASNLKLKQVKSIQEVNARKSWHQLPDCMNCHEGYEQPKSNFKSFNKWVASASDLYKNRRDDRGRVQCVACHNSPHAIYPTKNIVNPNHDNIQPWQYQNNPYPIGTNNSCAICHKIDMKMLKHHPNMDKPFRNFQLVEKHGLLQVKK